MAESGKEIVNKVASSGLVLLELDAFLPDFEITPLDIAPQLWQGMVLREKDFRTWVKEHDWSSYAGKHVAVYCSADAIVQHWAWMLLATSLAPVATAVHFGTPQDWVNATVLKAIDALNTEAYRDTRVVVKGCGKADVHFSAYGRLSAKLQPVVKSLMFGEPCSTVPVWKRG